jgi:voltage-gated potassium channel
MQPVKTLRRRVHFVLEVDRLGDRASRFVDQALVGLIVLNVLAAILQTDASIYARAPRAFELFELVSMALFGLEYVCRVWSCVEDREFQGVLGGRVRFALQPMMLLDLLVLVIPVYLDLRPLRILRLLRLGRYSPRLRLFARVIRDKRDELFVGLFVAVVLLVACSTAMFYVEGPNQVGFQSIPETMWWGVTTLTTVGYGDVSPVTGAGKILGALVALLGVGVFALPAGILASGFAEALDRNETKADGPDNRRGGGAEWDQGAISPALGHGGLPNEHREGTCPTCGASLGETQGLEERPK